MTTTASDPPREAAPAAPARPRRFISTRLAPWAASVGVHITLGTIAAVSLWSLTHDAPAPHARPAAPAPMISFHAPGDAGPAGSIDDPALPAAPSPAPERPADRPSPPPAILPEPAPATATPAAVPLPVLRSLSGAAEPTSMAPRAPRASVPLDLPPSAPDPAGLHGAAGPAAWDGGEKLPVRFAGVGSSSARRIVYVVDASGPMVTSLPDVISEIERSAQRLSASQQFAVVIVRDRGDGSPATEAFMPVLVRATPTARRHLGDWLAGVQPAGKSSPLDGVRAAFAYQPDAIFLLARSIERSGGGVDGAAVTASAANRGTGGWPRDKAAVLAELDRLNPADPATGNRRVAIKAIQFIDDDPTGIMQAIGDAHGGPAAAGPGYIVIRTRGDLAPPP